MFVFQLSWLSGRGAAGFSFTLKPCVAFGNPP
jgi:hypothetical protein